MRNLLLITGLFLITFISQIVFHSCSVETEFKSDWSTINNRSWVGPEYWANRMQDWEIEDGKVVCIGEDKPLRTLQLMPYSFSEKNGNLEMQVRLRIRQSDKSDSAWSGFLIGAGSSDMDYRKRALIFHSPGKDGGIIAAVKGNGQIFLVENEKNKMPVKSDASRGVKNENDMWYETILKIKLECIDETYNLTLTSTDPGDDHLITKIEKKGIPKDKLSGNIALVANGTEKGRVPFASFENWEIRGSKLAVNKKQKFGPIFGAMHTLSRNIMKMTVQLAPVGEQDEQKVSLQIKEKESEKWQETLSANIVTPGWTAHFRKENWDDSKDYSYQVKYGKAVYTGQIRHNPIEKEELVVAAFTGNNNGFIYNGQKGGLSVDNVWFPHEDIVRNIKIHNPDVLVYTGDQLYESRPYPVDDRGGESSILDYIYKWGMFLWAHGEVIRDRVTVCMPDDHDVFHGNVWGEGGKKAPAIPADGKYPDYYKGFEDSWQVDEGGYRMDAEFVKMVERTQTSHLPDPYDPTPVKQGIGVYYTDMVYGGISFAILEDRKFKSSPSRLLRHLEVINGFSHSKSVPAKEYDVSGAILLGERQLSFLENWAANWSDVWIKVVLAQTIFANVSTYPKNFRTDAGTPELLPLPQNVIPENYAKAKDMDSNGWPQTGRNKALRVIRKGWAFMIGGDQHLGSIVHHGIDRWDDAGYSFCVPSIANLWPRRWFPPKIGLNHQNGLPPYTGRYFDGFGNRINVWAVSNPYISGHEPKDLHDRAPGYGIVRFNRTTRNITMECWPRYADVSKKDARQYLGWPFTVNMEDNYVSEPRIFLPRLVFEGVENPVVQVIDMESGEVVYTVRIKGKSWRPKVEKEGQYTVKIISSGEEKTINNIKTGPESMDKEILVKF